MWQDAAILPLNLSRAHRQTRNCRRNKHDFRRQTAEQLPLDADWARVLNRLSQRLI